MLVMAAAVVYAVYSILLRGNFADGMVALFQKMFRMEYGAALGL